MINKQTSIYLGLLVFALLSAGTIGYFIGSKPIPTTTPESVPPPPSDINSSPPPPSYPKATESPPPSSTSKGPVFLTNSLTNAMAGENYNVFVLATGGGDKYAWKIISGSLPLGLKGATSVDCGKFSDKNDCRPSFQISGRPDAAGSYAFRLSVSDGTKSVYKDFVIVVEPFPKLTITTASLPQGILGASYEVKINGNGGNASFSWTLLNGYLPPGLSLISLTCDEYPCRAPASIVGRPSGTGVFKFIVILTSGTQSATKEFILEIKTE